MRQRYGSVAFAVLALFVCGFLWTFLSLSEISRSVAHAVAVRRAASSLLASLVDAEAGQRGYLATNDPSFLDPYQRAMVTTPPAVARLLELTKDTPDQQRR